jgi:parvulin-like peptidyl-prolyl isomerase
MLLIAAGCGPSKDVVATVGKEVITTKQFKESFITRFRTEDAAKTKSMSDRKRFIEEMAIGLAKYQEGLARGIDKRAEVADEIDKISKRKALDLLYQKKVVDAVVTDEAAKKFYDMSGEEIKGRHILLKFSLTDTSVAAQEPVKTRADSIKRAIMSGLDFKAAAKLFSEDATSAADSGDLGWFQWGRMVDEFQEAAWKAVPNKMAGPVKSPYGYHLILVEEKRPVQDRRPFEESKERIKNQLKEVEGQKMSDVAKEYVTSLRKDNKLEYKEPSLTAFREKLKDPNTPKSGPVGPVFTDAEKQQIAATYKNGKVTVADMLEKLGNNAARVDWTQEQSSRDLVNAIAEPKFLEENAKNMGLYKEALKDPSVLEQKKNAVIRLLEKDEVTDKIKPTEEDERKYYETHLDNYIQPETRTIREIFIKTDSLKCARVHDRAAKGEDFKKLTVRFNEKESTQNDTGRIGPFEQKRFGLIGTTAFQLKNTGEISDVVRVGDNFSVIQLLQIIPSRTKTLEEASAQVKREYRTFKTDELQKSLEKLVIEKHKLSVKEDKLTSVWPVSKEDGGPGKKVAREP